MWGRGESCVCPYPAQFETFVGVFRLGEHKVRPYIGGIKNRRRHSLKVKVIENFWFIIVKLPMENKNG